MRDGGPRVNRGIETAKKAWIRHKMYEDVNLRSSRENKGKERPFEYTYMTHVRKVIQEAKKGTF